MILDSILGKILCWGCGKHIPRGEQYVTYGNGRSSCSSACHIKCIGCTKG